MMVDSMDLLSAYYIWGLKILSIIEDCKTVFHKWTERLHVRTNTSQYTQPYDWHFYYWHRVETTTTTSHTTRCFCNRQPWKQIQDLLDFLLFYFAITEVKCFWHSCISFDGRIIIHCLPCFLASKPGSLLKRTIWHKRRMLWK